MPHLNIYLSKDLEKKVKLEAKRRGKSLSAYFASLVRETHATTKWPKDFLKSVYGAWKGEFPKIKDLPPEESSEL